MNALRLPKSTGSSAWRRGCVFITIAVASFAFSSTTRAELNPPPDGGYPNQTTAEGQNALFNLTSGINNTALGFDALWNDTTGGYNTATGEQALYLNVIGNYNTATGYRALYNNTASKNTADGFRALYLNTSGQFNTAAGFQALYNNTTADQNTAFGYNALYNNTTSEFNIAVGDLTLFSFNGTTVLDGANTAVGSIALNALTSGEENVAIGRRALEFSTSGSNNTALGWRAGDNYTGGESGNISIGSDVTGVGGENNKTRIGNITATAFTTGGFFLYEVNGAIGIFTSSRKFKDDIKPIDKASETIYSLNPVTFRAKPEADPSRPRGFGLIAEEVEKVNPDLVSHGEKDIVTVRYESINAMLLNEFLKEHKKVEAQEATIVQLKKDLLATAARQQEDLKALTATLKEQAKQIERVKALVPLTKPVPQLAGNN
ncbi:MAG: tail fiber domain-containing protein [Candidatus Udaeobacter sp.]